MIAMLISQDLFDETLLESQELFEYSDELAVEETISELQSGRNSFVRLDHLSLTHPNSSKGKDDREKQKEFVSSLQNQNLAVATSLLTKASEKDKKSLPSFASLVLQHQFLAADSDLLAVFDKDLNDVQGLLDFFSALLPDILASHPLSREIKLQLSPCLKEKWFPLYQEHSSLRIPMIEWARVCCNACEANKKVFVQAAISFRYDTDKNGLNLLLDSLPKDIAGTDEPSTDGQTIEKISKLLTVIGKFQASAEPQPQDGEEPLVSSAHANVKELHKCGAVHIIHTLAKQCAGVDCKEDLLCELLSVLRVMAIDNDIVQTMVAVGILETVDAGLQAKTLSPSLAGATLGLIRNLCANDEVKTNIRKKTLASILHAMETHASHSVVQEHGCGIFAAMSLRQPNNAVAIVEANGIYHILTAMRSFPNKVPLQRQGCLALRNIASRLPAESKQVLLDAGAENVLKGIAAKHQASIEEAYAALRDLGVAAVMYKVDETGKATGTQMFGSVKSNFRAVYD